VLGEYGALRKGLMNLGRHDPHLGKGKSLGQGPYLWAVILGNDKPARPAPLILEKWEENLVIIAVD
jgi:hypothetical protein